MTGEDLLQKLLNMSKEERQLKIKYFDSKYKYYKEVTEINVFEPYDPYDSHRKIILLNEE